MTAGREIRGRGLDLEMGGLVPWVRLLR